MDFEELVHSRKSVRGFKNKPVPRAVIEEIIEVAKRAPSSMNTQPWHVHVLTGEPLEQLRRRNMEEMVAGAKAKRDIVSHGEYEGRASQAAGRHRQAAVCGDGDCPRRQADAAGLGVARVPAVRRAGVAGLSYDRVLDPGAVCHFRSRRASAYGIVLAAWNRGRRFRHQRPGDHALRYRARSRRYPCDQAIMTCVAMGYPDDSFPANAVQIRPRAQRRFRPLCGICRLAPALIGKSFAQLLTRFWSRTSLYREGCGVAAAVLLRKPRQLCMLI